MNFFSNDLFANISIATIGTPRLVRCRFWIETIFPAPGVNDEPARDRNIEIILNQLAIENQLIQMILEGAL